MDMTLRASSRRIFWAEEAGVASLIFRRRRKLMRFMLMPLVDVIFLLLTFFLLSSSIAPFSSIMLDRDREPPAMAGAAPGEDTGPDLILSVGHGRVQANGRTIDLGGLPEHLARLRQNGFETVMLFTRGSATVQDLVSVLDAVKKAQFRSVMIRTKAATP